MYKIELLFFLEKKKKFLKLKFSKLPTYPLRLIKMTNVCVSGLTESSGTRFGQHF